MPAVMAEPVFEHAGNEHNDQSGNINAHVFFCECVQIFSFDKIHVYPCTWKQHTCAGKFSHACLSAGCQCQTNKGSDQFPSDPGIAMSAYSVVLFGIRDGTGMGTGRGKRWRRIVRRCISIAFEFIFFCFGKKKTAAFFSNKFVAAKVSGDGDSCCQEQGSSKG